MRYLLSVLLLPMLCAQESSAQQPAPQASNPALKKLQGELRQTADTVDTAFTVKLRDHGVQLRANRLVVQGTVSQGSFHKDLQLLTIKTKKPVHVVQAGRHTIVRAEDGPWCTGNKDPNTQGALHYLADPQRLLRVLSNMRLDIVKHSIEEIDGRASELVSVSLTDAQVDSLVFADAFVVADARSKSLRAMLARRGGDLKTPPATHDLVVVIDVERRVVSSLHLRSLSESVDMDRVRQLFAAQARGGKQEEEPETDEVEAPKPKAAPIKFVEGMPVRSHEGKYVVILDVDLRDHGKIKPPVLDEPQRRLLGR